MEGAAGGLAAHQRIQHGVGMRGHQLAHTRRGCALTTIDRDKGLGHGDCYLGRLKAHHGAITPYHLVLRVNRLVLSRRYAGWLVRGDYSGLYVCGYRICEFHA